MKYLISQFRLYKHSHSGVVNITNEEKLKYWMETYGKLVFSICYRLVHDYFSAEDLTQDTFLSAYTSVNRFDGKNEKAWLTRIATNKCLDYLKNAARRTQPSESKELELHVGSSAWLEDEYIRNELSKDIRKACENLRKPYCDVAVAYFCEDKPLSQIAKEKGEPLKTVQTRAYRAKKMLRENLKEVVLL